MVFMSTELSFSKPLYYWKLGDCLNPKDIFCSALKSLLLKEDTFFNLLWPESINKVLKCIYDSFLNLDLFRDFN